MASKTASQGRAQARVDAARSRAVAFRTGLSLGGLALLGLVPTILVAGDCVGGASRLVLWALGLWVSGVAIGFLFGIPRVLQGGRASAPINASQGTAGAAAEQPAQEGLVYRQRVNTNLEEISDWLTKIIVGMGLVELRSMPGHLQRLGAQIVGGSPAPCDPTLGIALALFFAVVGFLFGYLVTRLYIQEALAQAETDVATLTALAGLELRAESAEAELETVKAVAVLPSPAEGDADAAAGAAPAADVTSGLQDLASRYKAVALPDLGARVAAKNELAGKLSKFLVERGVNRDWLAQQEDEVMILGLATLVQAFPQDGDTERLLKAATKAQRLHVRYKVVLALSKLADIGALRAEDRTATQALLETWAPGADEDLSKRIAALREKLRSTS